MARSRSDGCEGDLGTISGHGVDPLSSFSITTMCLRISTRIHYGVDRETFATSWAKTGNHAFAALLQRGVGNTIWYCFSLAPRLAGARHEVVQCRALEG